MNTLLNLTIKRCWFDMIASGQKREEYRSLDNKKVGDKFVYRSGWSKGAQVMVLRNGYSMGSPALAVRVYGIILRNGDDSVHPEWGEPTDRTHFVIMLGDVLMRGTYAEVKEALKKGDGKSSNEKQETVADIVAENERRGTHRGANAIRK